MQVNEKLQHLTKKILFGNYLLWIHVFIQKNVYQVRCVKFFNSLIKKLQHFMRIYLMYTDVYIIYVELRKYRLNKTFLKIYLYQLKIETMLLFHPKLFEGFICICQCLSNSKCMHTYTDLFPRVFYLSDTDEYQKTEMP